MDDDTKEWLYIAIFAFLGVAIIILPIWGYCTFLQPIINVWQQSKEGEAELARAESNRQIATLEAIAKKESAKSLADAEVIRAEGVAKSNKIIGDSLAENEVYLRYLWIQSLDHGKSNVIYIPTEGNLPILESQRLKKD